MALTKEEQEHYHQLAAEAEGGALMKTTGTALRGADAAAAGRALLVDALGSDEALTAALRRGRPPASVESNGRSPLLQFRAAPDRVAALAELEHFSGLNRSDLLREGLELLLAKHTRNEPDETAHQLQRVSTLLTHAKAEVDALVGIQRA